MQTEQQGIFASLSQNPPIATALLMSSFGWFLNFIGQCVVQADLPTSNGFNVIGLQWYLLFLYSVWLALAFIDLTQMSTKERGVRKLALNLTLLVLAGVPSDINSSLGLISGRFPGSGNQLKVAGLVFLVLGGFALLYFQSVEPSQNGFKFPLKFESGGQPTLSSQNSFGMSTRNQSISSNNPVIVTQIQENMPESTSKAQALYDYNASSTDANEISFKKGEMFDVFDSRGKWWKVREISTQKVGIAPSNYLQLL